MATRRKPTKTLRPKPREKKVRLQVKRLQERAAADMRSIGNYLAFLVVRHLSGRGNGRRRRKAVARLGDKRISYTIAMPLTVDQKAQLQARAREEMRPVSSYVAKLIVEELGRG
jgi:hypothetical protein